MYKLVNPSWHMQSEREGAVGQRQQEGEEKAWLWILQPVYASTCCRFIAAFMELESAEHVTGAQFM